MCGIIGIYHYYKSQNLLDNLFYSLEKINNRGRDSYGYLVSNDLELQTFKNIGDVKYPSIDNNEFSIGLGQTRYATSYQKKNLDRTSKLYYTHPLKGEHKKLGLFYLVHNGNIYNLDYYKKKFKIEKDKSKTLDYSDSWLLVKLIEKLDYDNWKDLLINFIDLVPCAYSLILVACTPHTQICRLK